MSVAAQASHDPVGAVGSSVARHSVSYSCLMPYEPPGTTPSHTSPPGWSTSRPANRGRPPRRRACPRAPVFRVLRRAVHPGGTHRVRRTAAGPLLATVGGMHSRAGGLCAVEGIVSRPHKTTAQGVRRRRSLPLLVVASTQTLAGPPRSPCHLAPLGTRPVPLSCLRVSTATRRCLRARRVTRSSRPSSGARPGTLSVKL